MKKIFFKIISLIIITLILSGTANVFAVEDKHSPEVILSSSGVFYYKKGDGTLWEHEIYGNTNDVKVLDDVVRIGIGCLHMNHTAITSDGKLYCMNPNWQEKFEYTASNIMDVQSIYHQDSVLYLLSNEGVLYSVGNDFVEQGVLGQGENYKADKPVQILDNVASVYGADNLGVALKNDNTLWAWGCYVFNKPTKCASDIVSVEAVEYNAIYARDKNNSLWRGYFDDMGNFGYVEGLCDNVKTAAVSSEKVAYVDVNGTLYTGFVLSNNYGIISESTFSEAMKGVKDVILPKDYNDSAEPPIAVIKNDNSLWISTKYDSYSEPKYAPIESDFVKVMDNVDNVYMTEDKCAIVTKEGELYLLEFKTVSGTDRFGFSDNKRVVGDIKKIADLADFNPSDWAVKEIERAISMNLIPEKLQRDYKTNISRSDFCEILTKTIEALTGKEITKFLEEKNLNKAKMFTDTKSKYVDYMSRLGIVSGTSEKLFSPNAKITREQAAIMLQRTAKALGYDANSEPSSESGISDWAKSGVGFVTKNGIMNGTGNGFEPQGKYTKEQAIATFVRLFDKLK